MKCARSSNVLIWDAVVRGIPPSSHFVTVSAIVSLLVLEMGMKLVLPASYSSVGSSDATGIDLSPGLIL
jgi:hypothetical protein